MAIQDDAGTPIEPVQGQPRILSLVPSLTELLFDLDLGDCVVGRTSYCIHPEPAVRRVPSVGGTKKISMGRALSLRPSHAVVNVDENPKAIADELRDAGVQVLVTHPIEPADNLRLFALFGAVFHRRERAEELASRFRQAWERLVAMPRVRRRVLYLIWKDPWMTVSRETYIARMLASIGWETLAHDDAARYPVIEPSAHLAPADAVLLSSEPYPFGERDAEEFRQAYADFRGAVQLVDGALLSWYGSRSIAGLDYLRQLAAPGLVHP